MDRAGCYRIETLCIVPYLLPALPVQAATCTDALGLPPHGLNLPGRPFSLPGGSITREGAGMIQGLSL